MDDLNRWRAAEWLEADGWGGFASGTAAGIQTRRYHALLLAALQPPTQRVVLVNGCEAWIETAAGSYALSSHDYAPDVIHPDGVFRLIAFTADPWPTWTYQLSDGTTVQHELFVPRGRSGALLRWSLIANSAPPAGLSRLTVRPLLSGRDYHHLHHENTDFRFDSVTESVGAVSWQPYSDLPVIHCGHNGRYQRAPEWFRNFRYRQEEQRGLDCEEDLASPGIFEWDLTRGPAVWMLTAGTPQGLESSNTIDQGYWKLLADRERHRRCQVHCPVERAAESYIARRGSGRTIIAGYPWFTDWGRDTFISLRGLCLATGKLEEARQILVAWAQSVSEGMLPNRFPDAGTQPEFNSVDASLWFIIATYELLQLADSTHLISPADEDLLLQAVEAILNGYCQGTRFGIHCDTDGLLAAGQEGVALTWMDAKVSGHAITPRIGKPVEIQALWINSLRIGAELIDFRLADWHHAQASFEQKFWLPERGYLADVVDDFRQAGRVDGTLRPNQILAVGGLPYQVLDGAAARQVVDTVESRLWTPAGLRTLAPEHQDYRGRCDGGVADRDAAYHQGTVWPWLLGPFVQAWVRVRGDTPAVRAAAKLKFLDPWLNAAATGFGGPVHIPEIADGNFPHAPRGCPFQAWSLGEYLRLERDVLSAGR